MQKASRNHVSPKVLVLSDSLDFSTLMSPYTMRIFHIQLQAGTLTRPSKCVVPIKGRSTPVARRRWVNRIACTEKKSEESDDKTSTLDYLTRLLENADVKDSPQRSPAGM